MLCWAGGGAALGAGPPSVPGQVRQRWARAVRPLRTEPLHASRPAGLLPSALTVSLRDLFGRPPCRFPQAMLAGRGAGGPSRPPQRTDSECGTPQGRRWSIRGAIYCPAVSSTAAQNQPLPWVPPAQLPRDIRRREKRQQRVCR